MPEYYDITFSMIGVLATDVEATGSYSRITAGTMIRKDWQIRCIPRKQFSVSIEIPQLATMENLSRVFTSAKFFISSPKNWGLCLTGEFSGRGTWLQTKHVGLPGFLIVDPIRACAYPLTDWYVE
jgi:hypothetical protein